METNKIFSEHDLFLCKVIATESLPTPGWLVFGYNEGDDRDQFHVHAVLSRHQAYLYVNKMFQEYGQNASRLMVREYRPQSHHRVFCVPFYLAETQQKAILAVHELLKKEKGDL